MLKSQHQLHLLDARSTSLYFTQHILIFHSTQIKGRCHSHVHTLYSHDIVERLKVNVFSSLAVQFSSWPVHQSCNVSCTNQNIPFLSCGVTSWKVEMTYGFNQTHSATEVKTYVRSPPRPMLSPPLTTITDGKHPEQVHISLVGRNQMRVTWITKEDIPSVVEYGLSRGKYISSASGDSSSYSFGSYRSGNIHYVVIGPLEANTVYYYRCGQHGPEYNLKTPPSQFPIMFSVVGDLGQTGWTKSTLEHVQASDYNVFLLPGDLSYADSIQPLWDYFGKLVEPLASSRPWMVTEGNHEKEIPPRDTEGNHDMNDGFKSYNARWRMPYKECGSSSNLYYSFEVAGVHVLMLGSYAEFGRDSDQYKWLQADLARVDRERTPWLIVLLHVPWYNTNTAHQGEDEAEKMRQAMESLLYAANVDIVFAGHVHAYERFARVYNNKTDPRGPVYITIGDGGNREGLSPSFKEPQSELSLFREASFGHGELRICSATEAHWSWHRNQDDESVLADEVWIDSLSTSIRKSSV